MILPVKKDMLPFLNFTEKKFEKWLLDGITAYVEENYVWKFEPVAVFIGQDDLLCLDLKNIYEALPSKKSQNLFRTAVVKLLGSKKVSSQPVIDELYLLAKNTEIKLTSNLLRKVSPDLIERFGK